MVAKVSLNSGTIREALRTRTEFDANGTMRGTTSRYSTGALPAEHKEQYLADWNDITFTVLSYATPIGWVLADGTVRIPEVRYSQTTTRHQGLVRSYLPGR